MEKNIDVSAAKSLIGIKDWKLIWGPFDKL
jgi:hypothetical protein